MRAWHGKPLERIPRGRGSFAQDEKALPPCLGEQGRLPDRAVERRQLRSARGLEE
jgi:hypothetical protein